MLGRSTIIKKGRSTQKDLIDHSPKSKSYLIELLQIAAATENWITCSGLESIVEEMRTSGHDDINLINAALEEIIKGLAEKSKQGECWTTVAPLLYWKKHQTIRDQLDKKWDDLKKTYSQKIHFIPKLSKLAFGSGNDDVHLVDKSRERFFNHVLESSISYFVLEKTDESTTTEENSGSDMDTNEVTIVQGGRQSSSSQFKAVAQGGRQTTTSQFRNHPSSTPVTKPTKRRRDNSEDNYVKKPRNNPNFDLEDDVYRLRRRVERRWRNDALVFAKHDEQLDTIKNERTLDRIVISGVLIQDLSGTLEERKPKMFEAITRILRSFMDEPPAPTFANHLNAQFATPRRVLEVRFGSVDLALKVRRAYSEKIKECRGTRIFPDELNGINVGMTLTKSTKIRIAILKGLAKIVNNNTENAVNAYCLEFQTQPMLKITIDIGENRQTSRTYGLTEAIEHVSEHFVIRDQDLIDAYTVAGNMKQLEQRFVVLRNA